jgi:hypothetical protein
VLAALLSALLAGAEQEGEHKSYQHRPEREALRDSERDPEEGGDGADDHVSSLAAQVKGATALPPRPSRVGFEQPATFSLVAGDEFVPAVCTDLSRSQPPQHASEAHQCAFYLDAITLYRPLKSVRSGSPRLGRFDSCAAPFL